MSKSLLNGNELVSLAVLALMTVALVSGQADASIDEVPAYEESHPVPLFDDRLSIEFDRKSGTAMLRIDVSAVASINPLRGDE